MPSKIQDNNYFQISGWMLNRLKLKGTDLQIYAIIYGFSQEGQGEFYADSCRCIGIAFSLRLRIMRIATEIDATFLSLAILF